MKLLLGVSFFWIGLAHSTEWIEMLTIPWFPKIKNLNLISNSLGNTYIEFNMLEIKSHFSCGESKIH